MGGQRGGTKYCVFTGTAPKEHNFKKKMLSVAALLETMTRCCWKRLYGTFSMYVQGSGHALHYRCWILSYSLSEYVP